MLEAFWGLKDPHTRSQYHHFSDEQRAYLINRKENGATFQQISKEMESKSGTTRRQMDLCKSFIYHSKNRKDDTKGGELPMSMSAWNEKPQAELSAEDGSLPSASHEVANSRPSNARYRIADPWTAEQDDWLISKVQSKGKDNAVDWKEIEAQYEVKFGKPRPRRALMAKARKSYRITGPLYCATTWTQAQKNRLISEVDSWKPDSPDEMGRAYGTIQRSVWNRPDHKSAQEEVMGLEGPCVEGVRHYFPTRPLATKSIAILDRYQ